MNYEKAYKDALERMKSWARGEHPECFTEAQKAAEFIFPELAESEDEMIRKALIRFHKSTIDIDGIKGEDILAWLEKQGKQKPIYNFNAVDWQPSKVDGKIHNIYNSEVEPKFIEKKELRKIENSPILSNSAKTGKNWSDEDSLMIDSIIDTMKWLEGKGATNMKIDWLKSLKKRMEAQQ